MDSVESRSDLSGPSGLINSCIGIFSIYLLSIITLPLLPLSFLHCSTYCRRIMCNVNDKTNIFNFLRQILASGCKIPHWLSMQFPFNCRGCPDGTLASSDGIILWLYSNLPSFKTNSKLHTTSFFPDNLPPSEMHYIQIHLVTYSRCKINFSDRLRTWRYSMPHFDAAMEKGFLG